MPDRSGHPPPTAQTLIQAFDAFVRTQTWADCCAYAHEHPELLSGGALELVRRWVASMGDAEEAWTYRYHYALLISCQLMGIDAAFDALQPSAGPYEDVVAPIEFADDLRRLGELDAAAGLDPSRHGDRIAVLERMLRRLDEGHSPSFRTGLLINLAQAHAQLPTRDPAVNLGKAAACLAEASEFITPKAAPSHYPASLNKLGRSYLELADDRGSNNVEKAISCFAEALRYYTPEYTPLEYAVNQNDLGGAYARRASGDRAQNLRSAIECFREALGILTHETTPREHDMVTRNLTLAEAELERLLGPRRRLPRE